MMRYEYTNQLNQVFDNMETRRDPTFLAYYGNDEDRNLVYYGNLSFFTIPILITMVY